MSRGPVKIERYNPSWSIDFEKYKEKITEVLQDQIIQLEHIGSTAIEGLGAKPIIDIGITVRDVDDPEIIEKMEQLGFVYNDDFEDELPFRKYFILYEGDRHKVHVHIVPEDHVFFANDILFRDYLRQHPDIRDEYHLLKTRLASKYKDDREGYQKAKAEFIAQIKDQAKEYFDQEISA